MTNQVLSQSKQSLKYFLFTFIALSWQVVVLANPKQDELEQLKSQLSNQRSDSAKYELLSSMYQLSTGQERIGYARDLTQLDLRNAKFQGHLYLGNDYYVTGIPEEAMDNYLLAGNYTDDAIDQAKVYHGMSLVFESISDHENALRYIKKALDLVSLDASPYYHLVLSYSVGINYYLLEKYDSARLFSAATLSLADSMESDEYMVSAKQNLALIEWREGKPNQAIEQLLVVKALESEMEDDYYTSETSFYLGQIYNEIGDTEQAMAYAKNALGLAKSFDRKTQVRDISLFLSDLHAMDSQYDSAYQYFRQYVSERDSISNDQTANQMTQKSLEYEQKMVAAELELVASKRRTRWMLIIGGLVLLASLGFIYLRHVINKRQKALLQAKIQEATVELADRNDSLQEQHQMLSKAISETKEVVATAIETGDFSTRISLDGKKGDWLELAQSINGLFDLIIEPLHVIGVIAEGLAEGKLNQRFNHEAKGDILILKERINESMDKLSAFVLQIQTTIDEIAAASREMQLSSKEMDGMTQEINLNISHISKGMGDQVRNVDDISSLIQDLKNAASSIGGLAYSIKNKTEQGNAASESGVTIAENLVEQAIEAIDKAKESQDIILDLKKKSSAIADITSIIRQIADQTNMLSINAGIQAAHSGSGGKGFGIIAEEIRQLSDSSKASLHQIDELIQSVQHGIEQSVDKVAGMAEFLRSTQDQTTSSLEAFGDISKSYKDTLLDTIDISTATDTQSNHLDDVFSNVQSVVVIAEQSATGTEEIAVSCEELSAGMNDYQSKTEAVQEMLEKLQITVNRFVI